MQETNKTKATQDYLEGKSSS